MSCTFDNSLLHGWPTLQASLDSDQLVQDMCHESYHPIDHLAGMKPKQWYGKRWQCQCADVQGDEWLCQVS